MCYVYEGFNDFVDLDRMPANSHSLGVSLTPAG